MVAEKIASGVKYTYELYQFEFPWSSISACAKQVGIQVRVAIAAMEVYKVYPVRSEIPRSGSLNPCPAIVFYVPVLH